MWLVIVAPLYWYVECDLSEELAQHCYGMV